MAKSRVISDQEIEDGLELIAELIDRYGDVYWPLFDRLERELEERRSKAARLQKRLRRAGQTDSLTASARYSAKSAVRL